MPDFSPEALAALERHFGHRRFLDGQSAIVSALLEGRDVLAVLPTGGGKSLCYQLPALIRDGVTVVVSPLIALMKDQVDGLERRGIPATLINSTMTSAEQQRRIAELRAGRWKLVYVAPERFRQNSFVEALRGAGIGLLAVDEAHCISQWGHDFRPDYQRLGEAVERLGHPQLAAFTATATPTVRSDILRQLRLRDPFECVRGFSRPNLSLNATPCPKVRDKYERLKAVVEQHRTGIIYCATRSKVEEVHEQLREWHIAAGFYHGGMSEDARTEAQERFITKRDSVVVATNAFGMGIDRPDVRFVVHFEVPGSLEAYYQEAGRAGRDGAPGWCEVLFNYADTRTQEFFIDGNNPGFPVIADIYETLRSRAGAENRVLLSIEQIAEAAGVKNSMAVGSALATLSRSGYIDRHDVPGQRIRGTTLLRPEIRSHQLELNRGAMEEKERRDRDKLARVVSWCYDTGCRQKFILNYFGEAGGRACGTCDRCRGQQGFSGLREATAEELTLVRKALSGVARCSRKDSGGGWEGRFGRAKIIGMLTGSRAKEIIAAGLDQLSTYGLLQSQGAPWLQSLLRELESAGLLAVSTGEFPMIALTPSGEVMMKQGGSLRLNWQTLENGTPGAGTVSGHTRPAGFAPPAKTKSKSKPASPPPSAAVSVSASNVKSSARTGRAASGGRAAPAAGSVPESGTGRSRDMGIGMASARKPRNRPPAFETPGFRASSSPPAGPLSVSLECEVPEPGFDETLYAKLRELRSTLANRDGVPPFAIFNNQTLEFLTRLRPVTPAAGRRIRGISDIKAARYLQHFLDVISAHPG
ncbi:MAG: RecQ family ATP-dependent DNA helicase [Verrucomicrobiota bacterium]